MPYYANHGVRLHYVAGGPASPRLPLALIFQHDIGGDAAHASRLLTRPGSSTSDSDVRVVHADFRAHGHSETGAAESLSMKTLASDLVALLDHLGWEQAILGGIGLGAAVALRLAVERPDRCRALVLCRPAWVGGTMNAVARHALGLVATLLTADDWERSAGHRLARDGVFRHIQAVCGDAAQTLRELVRSVAARPETRAATIASLRELPRSRALDDPEALATVACPTLILAAQSDPLHPFECARELADALPNSRLVPIATGPADDRSSTEDAGRSVGEFLRAVQDGREHAPLETARRAPQRTPDRHAPSVV